MDNVDRLFDNLCCLWRATEYKIPTKNVYRIGFRRTDYPIPPPFGPSTKHRPLSDLSPGPEVTWPQTRLNRKKAEIQEISLNVRLVNNLRKNTVVPTHVQCGWFGQSGIHAVSHVVMVYERDFAVVRLVVWAIAVAKVGVSSMKVNAAQKSSVRGMNTGWLGKNVRHRVLVERGSANVRVWSLQNGKNVFPR